MLSCLYRSSVIPVFPKGALSVFAAVEFLRRLSCNQLQAFRNHLILSIEHQQVDVVGGDGVVENIQPKTLLRLEQPLQPALSVPCELEEKLLLMATMGNVPELSRDMMTVGSRHLVFPSFLKAPIFHPKWAF